MIPRDTRYISITLQSILKDYFPLNREGKVRIGGDHWQT